MKNLWERCLCPMPGFPPPVKEDFGAPGVPCSRETEPANGGEALLRANGRRGEPTKTGNDRLSITGRSGATASPGSGRQNGTGSDGNKGPSRARTVRL